MSGSVVDVVMGEKEDNFSEAICAICDNGGELICCEGKCLRAFHPTVEAGLDSACDSLGFSNEEYKGIETFTCENCQYSQHQCYVCGNLGSSDKSAGAKVFQCGAKTCGYFYHPSCVANALQFKYEDEPKDVEAEINSGKAFICPLHFCYACKEREQEGETDLLMQFAVCRRCPMAYHRKCLPGTIAFEADDDEGIIARAWEELIPNKVLIYCMEHMIDDELETPIRDHVKFPHTDLKKEKQAMGSVAEWKIVLRKRLDPSEGFKKTTRSKLLQCSERVSKAKRLDKSSLRDLRSSGPYSLREPKLPSALKQLHKSSSVRSRIFSRPYSLRDREKRDKYKMASMTHISVLRRKASSLENNSSSGKNVNAVLSNEDSEAAKSENSERSGSGKRRPGSKERADNFLSTTHKNPSNRHVESRNDTVNSCINGMRDSTSCSGILFKSLGFAPGPCRPFSEYSSAGWLNE